MKKTHSKLPNGVTVATVEMPGFNTVKIGVYVRVGSRHEPAELNGISHFLEHMAFKGTSTRSAHDISFQNESVGSHINACTGNNYTAYYTYCLPEYVESSLDILSDVLTNSVFPEEELERERGVILQEIAMYNDDPSSLCWDNVASIAYPDQPLGRPIIGTPEIIQSITRDDLFAYVKQHYTADNVIVAASGSVDHKSFEGLVEKFFSKMQPATRSTIPAPVYQGGYGALKDDIEQVHIVLGFPSVDIFHPDYWAVRLLSSTLGDGMSSPLFVEVREKRGLAYSVGTLYNKGSDHGEFYIHAGTSAESASELITIAVTELKKFACSVNPADLARAKNQTKYSLLASSENPVSMLGKFVNELIDFGRAVQPEETVAKIDSVTTSDISRVAAQLLEGNPTLQLVGNVSSDEDYYSVLQAALK